MLTVNNLLAFIQKLPLPLEVEKQTQLALADHLKLLKADFKKEYHFDDKNIIDFYFPGLKLGIEIKIGNASRKDIYRQIVRYCSFDTVDHIILLTNKSIKMPPTIDNKIITVIKLGNAWL